MDPAAGYTGWWLVRLTNLVDHSNTEAIPAEVPLEAAEAARDTLVAWSRWPGGSPISGRGAGALATGAAARAVSSARQMPTATTRQGTQDSPHGALLSSAPGS